MPARRDIGTWRCGSGERDDSQKEDRESGPEVNLMRVAIQHSSKKRLIQRLPDAR